MKSTTTILAALAAVMPATLAAPVTERDDPRFPPTGIFNGIILSYDHPEIHYSYLQASEGRFFLNKATNSSCGDINPVLVGGQGSLSLYNNDTEPNPQQVFVDISGAAGGILSYLGPLFTSLPVSSTHIFDREYNETISTLTYENKTWLACPDGDAKDYYVFAAAAYSKAGNGVNCLPFEIRTDLDSNPASCTYY